MAKIKCTASFGLAGGCDKKFTIEIDDEELEDMEDSDIDELVKEHIDCNILSYWYKRED